MHYPLETVLSAVRFITLVMTLFFDQVRLTAIIERGKLGSTANRWSSGL
jgi:hypothetical protein